MQFSIFETSPLLSPNATGNVVFDNFSQRIATVGPDWSFRSGVLLFTTAAELIEDLSNGSQKGRLHQSLATYTHPRVIIIDEVGYLTYGPDAANVLFHVMNVRHLKERPMIFTISKPLNQWGKTRIWRPSWIESWSEDGSSNSTGSPDGRIISSLRTPCRAGPSLPGRTETKIGAHASLQGFTLPPTKL
jgi:hypothetical protein